MKNISLIVNRIIDKTNNILNNIKINVLILFTNEKGRTNETNSKRGIRIIYEKKY